MAVRFRVLSLLVALAGAGLVLACGEEGVTPDCPPLPLYDARDPEAKNDPAVQAAWADAIAAGCATPVGTAMSGSRASGGSASGGSAGTSSASAGAGGAN